MKEWNPEADAQANLAVYLPGNDFWALEQNSLVLRSYRSLCLIFAEGEIQEECERK